MSELRHSDITTHGDIEQLKRRISEIEARLFALTEGAESLLATRDEAVARAAVIDLAQRVLPADGYAIWWLDVARREWFVVHSQGLSEGYAAQRVPGDVVAFTQPLLVNDVFSLDMLEGRKDAYRAEGIVALITVPLPIHGERRATLVAYHRSPHNYTEADLRVGMALGQIAAAALGNAETNAAQDRAKLAAERLYRDVEMANRAKDEFLALLSHELRTPLNAIMGWSQMLQQGLPAEMQPHALDVIVRNARSQKQLVEDLLDVARIATGKLDLQRCQVDLCDIARAAVESALPAAQAKGITLALEMTSESLCVEGDVVRLQQVAANLIGNAMKFTDPGGRVTVQISHRTEGAAFVVSDTGVGIPTEFLPHAFERFRQADGSPSKTYSGLGLGLWIVRQIAEGHGGQVRAESDGVGRGARVEVLLPAAHERRPLA